MITKTVELNWWIEISRNLLRGLAGTYLPVSAFNFHSLGGCAIEKPCARESRDQIRGSQSLAKTVFLSTCRAHALLTCKLPFTVIVISSTASRVITTKYSSRVLLPGCIAYWKNCFALQYWLPQPAAGTFLQQPSAGPVSPAATPVHVGYCHCQSLDCACSKWSLMHVPVEPIERGDNPSSDLPRRFKNWRIEIWFIGSFTNGTLTT